MANGDELSVNPNGVSKFKAAIFKINAIRRLQTGSKDDSRPASPRSTEPPAGGQRAAIPPSSEHSATPSETPEGYPRRETGQVNKSKGKAAMRDEGRASSSQTSPPSLPAVTVLGPDKFMPSARDAPAKTSEKLQSPAKEDVHFIYPELDVNHDTRLITINAAGYSLAPIVCQSKAVALHDAREYVALSHFWGPSEGTKEITINGKVMRVRRDLWEALIVLRSRKVGELWVDTLCIDQDDARDKERQIGKMSVIYSHASEVFAWLGPRDIDFKERPGAAEEGVTFLSEPLPSPLTPPGQQQVRAVTAVVNRPYWQRCWIIQEICISRKVTILCGASEADFTIFWENLQKLLITHFLPYIEENVREHLKCLGTFREQESAKTRDPRMSLIDALLLSRRSKSSYPREKIYAILQLAHDSTKLVDTPNYSQKDAVIFWKLAHNMIHLQGHVAIILLARRGIASGPAHPTTPMSNVSTVTGRASSATRRPSKMRSADFRGTQDLILPSWAPFWSKLDDSLPEWIRQSIEWAAPINDPPETTHDGQELCLRGWLLDMIVSVSGVPGLPRHPAPDPNESAEVLAERRRTETQRSTTNEPSVVKTFHSSAEVMTKLRSALLAPLSAKLDSRSLTMHVCSMNECGGKYVAGLAIATVLNDRSNSDEMVRRWWETNRSLVVESLTLEQWVNETIAASSPKNPGTNSRRRSENIQGPMCDLWPEIKNLSSAFELMLAHQMRLAVTSRCEFKIVYCEARVGDVIARVEHCTLPIVLRPLNARPWVTPYCEEPGTMQNHERPTRANSHLQPTTQMPSPENAPPTSPREDQFAYIGEVYRPNFESDTTWEVGTGWETRLFDRGGIRDFQII